MRAGLFPGQGLDPSTVLRGLQEDHPRLQRANTVLGYDLSRKVEQAARRSRPMLPTDLSQPAIFVAGVIAFERSIENGDGFDCLAGHSLGEYTALTAAGSIPFSHGLKLVAARGTAMKRAALMSDGGMAAVLGLATGQVETVCSKTGVTVANDNSPEQIVISGRSNALGVAAEMIRSLGGRTVLLRVDGAYHSPAMEPAVDELRVALEHTDIRSPKVPVISNVSAAFYRAPGEIRKFLLMQLTTKVRFRESIAHLSRRGVDEFIDLGPGRIVGRLAEATSPARRAAAIGA